MRPIAVGVLVLCGATAPAWPQQGPRLTIEPFVIRAFEAARLLSLSGQLVFQAIG